MHIISLMHKGEDWISAKLHLVDRSVSIEVVVDREAQSRRTTVEARVSVELAIV
jgi:hypothetical protein